MGKKTTDKNEVNLESKLDMLDELIEQLESDEISLDDAFEKYSAGIKLVKECNESIDRVEKKVQLLMDNGETEDFE
ncbi:MAG: exodeoxyribonuclease VII small subunit [Lachnospiraceae bacterium]|nr:exodeoxyribonuclease VII small subunit [Lachnospiraceae bacterium]